MRILLVLDRVENAASANALMGLRLAEQLLAESGLGTCWSGYFRTAAQESPAIQQALGLPEGYRVYSVLMVGVPTERYPNIPYRPAAEASWLE